MSDAVVEAVTRAIEKTSRVINDYGTPLLDNPEECARAAISVVIEECAKVADRMRDDVEKDSDWNYDDQCEAETLDLVASAIRSLKSPPTGENK